MDQSSKLLSYIDNSQKILILTGAGISTSSGIPDFRGPNGLYHRVQEQYNLPYPEALFDLDYFCENPQPFFSFSKELFQQDPDPTLTHRLLAKWEQLGKVNLVVTQNIDMLHQKAGSERILECHGGYQTGKCLDCGVSYDKGDFWPAMIEGKIPFCSCDGVIKPDVVFFGEQLPQRFYEILESPPQGDLMLVLGTSLTVYPAAQFALQALGKMPSILITSEPTEHDRYFDLVFHEELDLVLQPLADQYDLGK